MSLENNMTYSDLMEMIFRYNTIPTRRGPKKYDEVQVRNIRGEMVCMLSDLDRSLTMAAVLYGKDCLNMDVKLFGQTFKGTDFRITMSRDIVLF